MRESGSSPLEPTSYGGAADVITDALLHDPGWLDVGPGHAGHRRFAARRYHRAALAVKHRYRRPICGAFRDGPPHRRRRHLCRRQVSASGVDVRRLRPGFLTVGPGAVVRGLRVSAIQDRGHLPGEHVFPLDSDGYRDPDQGRPTLSGLGATVAANPDSVEERGRSAARALRAPLGCGSYSAGEPDGGQEFDSGLQDSGRQAGRTRRATPATTRP
jgi:hypothetical protein